MQAVIISKTIKMDKVRFNKMFCVSKIFQHLIVANNFTNIQFECTKAFTALLNRHYNQFFLKAHSDLIKMAKYVLQNKSNFISKTDELFLKNHNIAFDARVSPQRFSIYKNTFTNYRETSYLFDFKQWFPHSFSNLDPNIFNFITLAPNPKNVDLLINFYKKFDLISHFNPNSKNVYTFQSHSVINTLLNFASCHFNDLTLHMKDVLWSHIVGFRDILKSKEMIEQNVKLILPSKNIEPYITHELENNRIIKLKTIPFNHYIASPIFGIIEEKVLESTGEK